MHPSLRRFSPIYSLRHCGLGFRATFDGGQVSSRRRDGLVSQPELHLLAFPGRVVVEVHHHFSSGHMWTVEQGDDALDVTFGAGGLSSEAREALGALVGEGGVEALDALYGEPGWLGEGGDEGERWGRFLALFEPRLGAGPDRVAEELADYLELGRSSTHDGRVPYLTLRLGRRRLEVVLDHSFVYPDRQRRFEVLGAWEVNPPQALDDGVVEAVAGHFGAELGVLARWYYLSPR